MHQMPVKGKIVFLSQSGAVCTSVLDMAMQENVGFSHFKREIKQLIFFNLLFKISIQRRKACNEAPIVSNGDQHSLADSWIIKYGASQ